MGLPSTNSSRVGEIPSNQSRDVYRWGLNSDGIFTIFTFRLLNLQSSKDISNVTYIHVNISQTSDATISLKFKRKCKRKKYCAFLL